MRIALVSTSYYPDKISGKELYLMKLQDYLEKRGHDVKVFVRLLRHKVQRGNVVQVTTLSGETMGYFSFCLKTSAVLAASNFDVIHGLDFEGELACLFTYLLSHKKYILEICTVPPSASHWRRQIALQFVKYSLEKAEKILIPSHAALSNVSMLFPCIDISRFVVIPRGVNNEMFSPEARNIGSELKSALGLEDKRVILYFGRIDPAKGIDDIIKAYQLVKKELDDVALVVSGSKYAGWYKGWLRERYRDVVFLYEVPHERAPEVYGIADMYCVYSKLEGFCNTLIEAMACGLPVICSDVPVFREVSRENAVFVPPDNPSKLGSAMKLLLEQTRVREDLSNRGIALVKRYYSWPKVLQLTERVYEEVAGYAK